MLHCINQHNSKEVVVCLLEILCRAHIREASNWERRPEPGGNSAENEFPASSSVSSTGTRTPWAPTSRAPTGLRDRVQSRTAEGTQHVLLTFHWRRFLQAVTASCIAASIPLIITSK